MEPNSIAILRLSFGELARCLDLPKGVYIVEIFPSRDGYGNYINQALDVRLVGEGLPLTVPGNAIVRMGLDDFRTTERPGVPATDAGLPELPRGDAAGDQSMRWR